MILPAQEIRCLGKKGVITPFNERTVHNGKTFGLGPAGYDVRIAESVVLPAGGFSLASTIEAFDVPTYLMATVADKSSWARRGVCVQNTIIEPGWRGYLTLELTNHSTHSIMIDAGDPIAQIVFMRLLAPTNQPYCGKYQDQEAGPQVARDEH